MKDQVLIARAGPVGLTMALELARCGIPVRVVDKILEVAHTSRAVAVWPCTLEPLDRPGAATDIIAAGNKVTVANTLSGDRPVASLSLDEMPSPYPVALMVQQSEACCGVSPELGIELPGFEQDEDGLSAHLQERDGTECIEQYVWLVACDSPCSVVRHRLGLRLPGVRAQRSSRHGFPAPNYCPTHSRLCGSRSNSASVAPRWRPFAKSL